MRHELLRADQGQPISEGNGQGFRLVGSSPPCPRYSATYELPLGAQARLMQAAAFSQTIGHPTNTLLTINAAHLQRIGEGGVFGIGHLWDGFQVLLELIRKWFSARGVFWAVIWAREWARRGHQGQAGEHWHIAFHLPKHLRADFARQVAVWTGEGVGEISPNNREAAISAARAWCLTVSSGRGDPVELAAYLGKAEPGRIMKYGKHVPNTLKPRTDRFGGEGYIEGKRFYICKKLGPTAQAAA